MLLRTLLVQSLLAGILLVGVAQAQLAVNPQNLFDAGLNLGYVRQHGNAGSDPGNLATFAANFSAEWLVAVNPTPPPLSIALDPRNMPQTDVLPLDSVRSYLAAMPYCIEPYYTSRIALFDAGYFLGLAIASTASNYTVGVKSALSSGGLPQSLSIIGRNTGSDAILLLAGEVSDIGVAFQAGIKLDETRERHASVFLLLDSIRNELNLLLPNLDVVCENTGSASPNGAPFFGFREILSGEAADTNDVEPTRLDASLHGGALEVTIDVPGSGGKICKAQVLYEWRFPEPISHLEAKDEVSVELKATLLSEPCPNARQTTRASGSNNGSVLLRERGLRTASDISASSTPITARREGESSLTAIKVIYVSSQYSFFKLSFIGSAPRGSNQLSYEVVYLYDKHLLLPSKRSAEEGS